MDLTIPASEVNITPKNYDKMAVNLEGVDISDIISQIGTDDLLDAIGKEKAAERFGLVDLEEVTEQEAVDHFGADVLLKTIGKDQAIEHFSIVEAPENAGG